jgi:hypothetical protein
MISRLTSRFCFISLVVCLVLGPSAPLGYAREDTATPEAQSSTNPTNRAIQPRKDQSPEQQWSDQQDCYDWTCELIDWDPYLAYEELSANGFALAMTPEQMEAGLVCLAANGAVAGAIAGEVLGDPHNGAEIGVAIGLAAGLIHSSFLMEPENPDAQRAISRFERNLKKWERKYAGCMSRKGYRVVTD